MRDLCSKLINNILSSKCDKSGALKMRNRVNTVNFDVLINQTLNEDYIVSAKRSAIQINSDLSVNEINQIIQQRTPPKGTDTKKIQSYIALYCYDASSPVNINCEDDLKKGIYHFYFGRDRGLVKNINFSRSQVTGLREMNYIRESTGQGLEQLMTPYDVEMKMVGNNLFINGMMIFINPSGFGRKIGQPDEVGSVSYSLKLGGYHTIYRIESVLSTSGFETTVKARWTSSGTPIITSKPKEGTVAAGGTTAQTVDSVEPTCELDDSGFDYPVSIGSVPTYLGSKVPPG
jgi:hypothetical protein